MAVGRLSSGEVLPGIRISTKHLSAQHRPNVMKVASETVSVAAFSGCFHIGPKSGAIVVQ